MAQQHGHTECHAALKWETPGAAEHVDTRGAAEHAEPGLSSVWSRTAGGWVSAEQVYSHPSHDREDIVTVLFCVPGCGTCRKTLRRASMKLRLMPKDWCTSGSALHDWRLILTAFRSDPKLSERFQLAKEIDRSKGLIVDRETYNDPYANAGIVARELVNFIKGAPDPRDWKVTLLQAVFVFRCACGTVWTAEHWACVSEKHAPMMPLLTQVCSWISGACLDSTVETPRR